MTRKQALTDLLAKVEAGVYSHPLAAKVFGDDTLCQHKHWSRIAHNGSLDAAKALFEAVLPGWRLAVMCQPEVPDTIYTANDAWSVRLWNSNDDSGWDDPCGADTPARAWLIAIIKALIAEETQ